MKLKVSLVVMVLLAVACWTVYYSLQTAPALIPLYSQYIYYPFQALRGGFFNEFPFSIGDMLYIIWGGGLLIGFIRWIYYITRFAQYKDRIALSVVKLVNMILFVYLFFVLGWGANYYKPTLRSHWGLSEADTLLSVEELKAKSKDDLAAFDEFLVTRLNEYAPHFRSLPFEEINRRAVSYYANYTDTRLRHHGLGIKPSFFGYFLERLAVEGYYNPFTGEGQVNDRLPAFIMPFLVCHEMAHQAGVAAEGDANLMAYALCTASDDSSFRYSSYLDIWLYTNIRLYRRDSALALKFEDQLNPVTKAHIDTIEQISKAYQNDYARYSTELFDAYLKMQDQKEGVKSYGNVAASAWQLELKRRDSGKVLIRIP